MSFSITNNSAVAVITSIGTLTAKDGSFTVGSGSFPLFSGDTVSGTNTTIANGNGSNQASILLFLQQGNAQLELYVNGSLVSAGDYSSGLVELKGPILLASDTIAIAVDEAELPVPSPTPTNTATPTGTAAVTPTQTPTNTGTPTPTPTASGSASTPYVLKNVFFYGVSGVISGITGNITANGSPMIKSGTTTNDTVEFQQANFPLVSTASTFNLTLSASPEAGYVLVDDGTAGLYDKIVMTGWTYYDVLGQTRFSGTSLFFSGNTQLPYTENGSVIFDGTYYNLGGAFDTGYFNIQPTP
jgi:hypothetical protein